MVKVLWCPLVDPESGFTFLVSPRTGGLLAFPNAQMLDQSSLAILRRRERLLDQSRVEVLDSHDDQQGYLGQPRRRASAWHALALRGAWLLAEALARWAPLDWSFGTLDRIARSVPAQRIPIVQTLDATVFAERTFYRGKRMQACLPRTLLRFFLLRLGRYPVEANIGNWVPTEMMHAWVSLAGVPLGEEREEVMHYRACLRFTAAATA